VRRVPQSSDVVGGCEQVSEIVTIILKKVVELVVGLHVSLNLGPSLHGGNKNCCARTPSNQHGLDGGIVLGVFPGDLTLWL